MVAVQSQAKLQKAQQVNKKLSESAQALNDEMCANAKKHIQEVVTNAQPFRASCLTCVQLDVSDCQECHKERPSGMGSAIHMCLWFAVADVLMVCRSNILVLCTSAIQCRALCLCCNICPRA